MGFVDSILKFFSCHCDSDCNRKEKDQYMNKIISHLEHMDYKLSRFIQSPVSDHRYLTKPSPPLEPHLLEPSQPDMEECKL